ncbi:PREDICTED: uncharacterized protein LOC104771740 isoform X2 [Camelina sativa]|uniref:Uncharacterized protein LOC104771740 isoform X2 n=1 Tax=Camelina sativa TaxID=90675 RepID=A0ABM1RE32_CAMSA|nr:PREDICTED: uncharacterized protein LOC104771740 isoform X2 [Camelina sativa]
MLDELTRCNEGLVLEALIGTCLPGWEIPAWFSHRAFGSVLKPKLPPHWSNNRLTGIALCAVVLFPSFNEQRSSLLVVKCNCVFNNKDGSSICFSSIIGSWREPSNTLGKIESSHVFIGYTSTLDYKIYDEKEDEEGCRHTEASFEFQVTDGTQLLEGCKVLKCGFSLVYATDDMQVKFGVRRSAVEETQYRAHSRNDAISNVRRDTTTAGISQGESSEHKIVELPNKIIAPRIPSSPQPPITTPLFPLKYSTGSKNLEGERHVQTSDMDTRLSEKPQQPYPSRISKVASSSQAVLQRSRSYIYVSFHEGELRKSFVNLLLRTLRERGFIVLTNNYKGNGTRQLEQLYKRIGESKIALAIFSKRYVESNTCLNELVMMDKLAKEGKLLVIPVFFDVRSSDVKNLEGEFGRHFKKMSETYKDEPEKVQKWKVSVTSITKTIDKHSELYGFQRR